MSISLAQLCLLDNSQYLQHLCYLTGKKNEGNLEGGYNITTHFLFWSKQPEALCTQFPAKLSIHSPNLSLAALGTPDFEKRWGHWRGQNTTTGHTQALWGSSEIPGCRQEVSWCQSWEPALGASAAQPEKLLFLNLIFLWLAFFPFKYFSLSASWDLTASCLNAHMCQTRR